MWRSTGLTHRLSVSLCFLQYDQLPDIADEEGQAGTAAAGERQQGGDAQQPAAAGAAADAAAAAPAAGDKRDAQAAALEAAREKSKKAKEGKPQGWFDLKVRRQMAGGSPGGGHRLALDCSQELLHLVRACICCCRRRRRRLSSHQSARRHVFQHWTCER